MLENCVSEGSSAMQHQQIDASSDALNGFLAELGELSRRYGLGLTDGATLFLMDAEDYHRAYSADEDSCLSFA